MIVYPNAKVNIGLYITGLLPDGYRSIETVFYPVELYDILEINKHNGDKDIYDFTGLTIDCEPEKNLCYKAVALLRKQYKFPDIHLHLHKQIPFGSGLGGGSSDAAFTLKAINQRFELGISDDNLEKIALELGSDCPFFIRNKPVLATGRGEIFENINLDLNNYRFEFVFPPFTVSTSFAYSKTSPKNPKWSLKEWIQKPVYDWRKSIFNDFEEALNKDFPDIERIKKELYSKGAVYASLSGSGSTVFGIYTK